MAIDAPLFEHHCSKTHPFLESNPGFLGYNDHRPHALNHGFQVAIECNDRSWFPLQMFSKRMTRARVRLVSIGDRSTSAWIAASHSWLTSSSVVSPIRTL